MARELKWTSAGGFNIVLNDRANGYRVLKGASGLGLVAPALALEAMPLVDGAALVDAWSEPRTIMLPMMVSGVDNFDFRRAMGDLARALRHPREGINPPKLGTLQLSQADGQRFNIDAHYGGGLEGLEDKDLGGDTTWLRFILKLICPDPYWYSPWPEERLWEYEGEESEWFPIFPLNLNEAQVLGDVTLSNTGEGDAWPTWTITGPNTDIALINNTTGEELRFTEPIPDGQKLIIKTKPGEQSIALDDGTDWWEHLDPSSDPTLWRIPPGDSSVSLSLSGADEGSSVRLEYVPRYESPWMAL